MRKEQVLEALSALGFMTEEMEGFGYSFEYEGLTVFYTPEEEESGCVTLIAPNIYDIPDDDRMTALEIMVELSGRIKYAQPYIMFDNRVWLKYQHYAGENEVTVDLIEQMIRVLAYGTVLFGKIKREKDDEN